MANFNLSNLGAYGWLMAVELESGKARIVEMISGHPTWQTRILSNGELAYSQALNLVITGHNQAIISLADDNIIIKDQALDQSLGHDKDKYIRLLAWWSGRGEWYRRNTLIVDAVDEYLSRLKDRALDQGRS